MPCSRALRRFALSLSFPLCFPASSAFAETVELVTYYPTSASAGNQHVTSLTVGTNYAGETPDNGEALFVGPVGIGTNAPAGSLHVVGVDDAVSNVLFMPGADTGAAGTPDIRVGIGTAAPRASLDIVGTAIASGAMVPLGGNGDVNGDGVISSIDLLLIINFLDGGPELPEPRRSRADVTADGLVNADDATAITNALNARITVPLSAYQRLIRTTLDRITVIPEGSVGIGTAAPAASALLDMSSTTQGFLPPRMTTAQRDAIAGPVAGLMVYNTSTGQLNFYNGSTWTALVASSGGITQVVFASAGTTNWTVPAGVTGVTVEVWGGGGGGGGSPNAGGAAFGHGGGGGGYGRQLGTVTPGTTLTVTVGAGGTGQKKNSNPGANGGTSSVSGMVSPASISATGGRGGSSGGIEGDIVGRGGTSTATFNISGQDAVAPFFTLYQRAGGAGGNGGMGSVGELNSTRFIGTDGTAPGGGGCGWFARSASGSNNGAPGRVVITYSS